MAKSLEVTKKRDDEVFAVEIKWEPISDHATTELINFFSDILSVDGERSK